MQLNNFRSSVFRLLTDLIKSDEVITLSEMLRLEEALKHFEVSEEDRVAGFGMTLREAVETIASASKSRIWEVRDAMRAIAMSDNECCRSEAILIMLIQRLVEGHDVRLFSKPASAGAVFSSQVLYLDCKPRNEYLDANYGVASRAVEVAGFELVYVPEVVRNVDRWADAAGELSSDPLSNVFRIISPSSSQTLIRSLVDKVRSLDTRSFCNEVLKDRLGINPDITGPTWMLRLCDDVVNGVPYANYLFFGADEKDLRGQLREMVDALNSLQGAYSIVVNRHRRASEDFQYGEFYKILFDALSRERHEGWRLNFYCQGHCPKRTPDGKKCQVSYLGEDGLEIPVALSGREAAFLLLLLHSSAKGGLNLRSREAQETYARLYSEISPRENVPDLTESSTLRPIKHRVAKAVSESGIPDAYRFLPETVDGRLKVAANAENVRLIRYGEVCRLK